MGAFRLRVNQGIHIDGEGVSIDVIVVARGGCRDGGEACLEIIGLDGVDKMCLASSENLVHLGKDIYLGILRSKKQRKLTNEELMRNVKYNGQVSERIRIAYDIPRDFKCELRRYA